MRTQITARLLLFSVLLLASMVLIASPASASIPVRGSGSYGILSDHSPTTAVPIIGGNGSSFLTDALYQCQYDGTPCPVDLTNPDPNLTTAANCTQAGSSGLTGAAPCYDLLLTINPGATFTPGSTLSITIPGFSDPNGDEFGLVTCPSGPTQGFAGFCTAAVPAGCDTASSSISGGTVNIPTACLAGGVTFYFDETANNSVTSAFVAGPTTSAPEPTTFMLLAFGLVTLALFSKQLQRS
ncbi:MAG TPA: hypothetical protein VNU20_06395 [Candidatus Sulfotelmatobacter sp.]|jgi:hypothetical protein|nr:hypothetical protein [Candidatus Sulfotelmatobacter sp.]